MEYILADRKEQAKWLREKAAKMHEEIKKMENEADYLEKFKDDEEETAYKLAALMKKKDDPQAMAEILRQLKKTNLI